VLQVAVGVIVGELIMTKGIPSAMASTTSATAGTADAATKATGHQAASSHAGAAPGQAVASAAKLLTAKLVVAAAIGGVAVAGGALGDPAARMAVSGASARPHGAVAAAANPAGPIHVTTRDAIAPPAPPATLATAAIDAAAIQAAVHDLIAGRATLAELAGRYGLDPTIVAGWRRVYTDAGLRAVSALVARRRSPTPNLGRRNDHEPGVAELMVGVFRWKAAVTEAVLAPTTAAGRARCHRGGFELLEVLEHADHRVARRGVRLVRDRAAEADAQLGAELRLDQAIGAKRLFRIIVAEIGLTTGSGDPNGGERSSPAARLRDSELFDRAPEPLADQRYWGQGNQTIVVVVRST
jgi:hypothetical protein